MRGCRLTQVAALSVLLAAIPAATPAGQAGGLRADLVSPRPGRSYLPGSHAVACAACPGADELRWKVTDAAGAVVARDSNPSMGADITLPTGDLGKFACSISALRGDAVIESATLYYSVHPAVQITPEVVNRVNAPGGLRADLANPSPARSYVQGSHAALCAACPGADELRWTIKDFGGSVISSDANPSMGAEVLLATGKVGYFTCRVMAFRGGKVMEAISVSYAVVPAYTVAPPNSFVRMDDKPQATSGTPIDITPGAVSDAHGAVGAASVDRADVAPVRYAVQVSPEEDGLLHSLRQVSALSSEHGGTGHLQLVELTAPVGDPVQRGSMLVRSLALAHSSGLVAGAHVPVVVADAPATPETLAVAAFSRLTAGLANPTLWQQGDAWAVAYQRPDGRLLTVVWATRPGVRVVASGYPMVGFDLLGAPRPITRSMEIGATPIYILGRQVRLSVQ